VLLHQAQALAQKDLGLCACELEGGGGIRGEGGYDGIGSVVCVRVGGVVVVVVVIMMGLVGDDWGFGGWCDWSAGGHSPRCQGDKTHAS
jgi:hypothetical protein